MAELRLAALDDLHPDRLLRLDFFGRPLIVYRVGNRPVATIDACTHAGGPVELSDGCLQCAWHGARFDPDTGLSQKGPAENDARLTQLPLEVRTDGSVWYIYGQPPSPGATFYPVAPRAVLTQTTRRT